MLYGYIGTDKYKQDVPLYLDNWFTQRYEPSWAEDGFMARVIKEIDKSEFIPPYNVISPILGSIPLDWISGGSKTLIQIANMPESKFYSSYLGDNCVPLLRELSNKQDVHIIFDHFLMMDDGPVFFPDFDLTTKSREELFQFFRKNYIIFKRGWNGNYGE